MGIRPGNIAGGIQPGNIAGANFTGPAATAAAVTAANSWAAAVVSNSGTVSTARLGLITSMINQMMASGYWTTLDDAVMLCAENAPQALTSLKLHILATAVGSPTFTADRGYGPLNGTSQYINTNFVPSVNGTGLTGTNQRIAVYERTNVNANTTSIGMFTSATVNLHITTRQTTSMICSLNSGTGNFAIVLGQGFSVVSRSGGGTTMKGFKNGQPLTDVTGLTVGATTPAIAIYVGARNNAGTADSFRTSTPGYADYGAPNATAAVESAGYGAIQSHLQFLGAAVS